MSEYTNWNNLLFGISAFGLGLAIKNSQKKLKSYKSLSEAPQLTPQSIKYQLDDNPLQFLKSFDKQQGIYQKNVLVSGKIESDQPLNSSFSQGTNLIYRKQFEREIFSNEKFMNKNINQEYQITTSEDIVPYFLLKDCQSINTCRIDLDYTTNFSYATEDTGKKVVLYKLNFTDKILMVLGYGIQLLHLIFRKLINFRGIKIGYEQGELGIKVDSNVIVYGKLLICQDNNNNKLFSYFIEKPKYLLQNSEQLLFLKFKKLLFSYGVTFMMLTTTVITGYFALERMIHIKKQKQIRTQRELFEEHERTIQVTQGMLCTTCKVNQRNVILRPCNHLCICRNCWEINETQQSRKCPICKITVTQKIDIYVS